MASEAPKTGGPRRPPPIRREVHRILSEVLDAEARAAEKLDTKLAAEARWLHRGVTARRKRNQGRMRELAAHCVGQMGDRERLGQDPGSAVDEPVDRLRVEIDSGDHQGPAGQIGSFPGDSSG